MGRNEETPMRCKEAKSWARSLAESLDTSAKRNEETPMRCKEAKSWARFGGIVGHLGEEERADTNEMRRSFRGVRSVDSGYGSGGENRGDTNLIREGFRGQPEEMQRSWQPTGKILRNVLGGIVDNARGGEGEEERQYPHFITGKRGEANMMQNGPGEEEEEER